MEFLMKHSEIANAPVFGRLGNTPIPATTG
jgi:hypothetical protein